MSQIPLSRQSYILRMWNESPTQLEASQWRFALVDSATGQPTAFSTLGDVFGHLAEQIAQIQINYKQEHEYDLRKE